MTSQEELIVAMWLDGAGGNEIGAVVGMSGDTVRGVVSRLRRQGVDLAYRNPNGVKTTGQRRGTPYDQMLAGTWRGAA